MISTAQRPVPLEHFLYAGRETYKIVDAKRNFVAQGYTRSSIYLDAINGSLDTKMQVRH